MKKLVSLVLTIVLVMSSAIAFAEESSTPLTRGKCAEILGDVAGYAYECQDEAIFLALKFDVMSMTSKNSFEAEKEVSRAEFAYYLCRAAGWRVFSDFLQATRFQDVPKVHWASGIIYLLDSIDIFKDVDGYLRPDETISLEEAEVYVSRLAELLH